MKKTILNLGTVLLAFILGLAINNACADNLDSLTDTELRKLVSQLQQEINSLKTRVTELEGRISSSSNPSSPNDRAYAFKVDGIHYDMNGTFSDPIDYYELSDSYSITGGVRTDTPGTNYKYSYTYDSNGRISSILLDASTYLQETQYSYSNNMVTYTYKTTYKNPVSAGTSESGYKTVYHLKKSE